MKKHHCTYSPPVWMFSCWSRICPGCSFPYPCPCFLYLHSCAPHMTYSTILCLWKLNVFLQRLYLEADTVNLFCYCGSQCFCLSLNTGRKTEKKREYLTSTNFCTFSCFPVKSFQIKIFNKLCKLYNSEFTTCSP